MESLSGLEKATITTEDKKIELSVMFNPNEYTITRSNKISQKSVSNKDEPILQRVGGSNYTLSMQLFFYTYEYEIKNLLSTGGSTKKLQDVRQYTDKIFQLMQLDSNNKQPLCTFKWGSLEFEGYIISATQKFTMFLDSGIPVKATVDVEIQHSENDNLIKQKLDITNVPSKFYALKAGESLALVAAAIYGTTRAWRKVAKANKVDNPRKVQTGKKLKIPPKEIKSNG